MCRSVVLVLAVFALAGAGCASTNTQAAGSGDPRIAVPGVVGTTLRDATCRLTGMHLRWRFPGEGHATTGPLSGCGSQGVGSSLDDIRVTGQSPRAGARVRRGTVIVLRTPCTTSQPCA
jgi:hypothetical protein